MHNQISALYAVLYDFLENMGLDEEPAIAIFSFDADKQNQRSNFCSESNTIFLNLGYFKTLDKSQMASAMLTEVFKHIKINTDSF